MSDREGGAHFSVGSACVQISALRCEKRMQGRFYKNTDRGRKTINRTDREC